MRSSCGADRGTQLGLSLAWRQHPDLDFRDVEFRNHSQNGEDGILLYLFSLAGPVDGHGRQARFTWHLTPVGAAEPTAIGFDVAVLTDDGRLSHVYGFLDKVPS